jgi:hypothetical protein
MSVDDQEKPALYDPSPLVIHPLEPIPPGRYRQSRFQKISETLMSWIFFTGIIGGGLYYGVHLLMNYIHLEKEFRENSAKIAHPRVFENQASDIGYIYSMRRETLIREEKLNLVWFVVVPTTNIHYSCPYEYGYPDFKTGDSVRLIHTTSEDEGDYGYIVGLHDQEQGKATAIWNFDLDTAELDDIPDNN